MKTITSIYNRHFAFAYVLLVAVIFCGCDKPKGKIIQKDGFTIKIIDSCEYIEVDSGIGDYYRYTLTHKGNCKFCEERSKK